MNSLGQGGRGLKGRRKDGDWVVIASYVFDWAILIAVGVVGLVLGNITPNKRPFSLEDPNISYVLHILQLPCLWSLA
jgi:hypothetical protein